jgi:predicted nuclease of predicted toxin-antitoxin system
MVSLYSNENFPKRVVDELRRLGHDVLTSYEAGLANQKIPDDQVLQFAISQNRAVLTLNRID